MYDNKTKDQFVELRARGKSLGAISTELIVPKSTLGDWDKQLHDQIARLRAIEWEAIEEQFGRTMEQDLRAMAERIRRWETRIDRMNPDHFDIRHVLAVLRETRREYFRRRAILMAPLERTIPSRSKHPDESGRFLMSSDRQPRNTSHLQPSPSESSGSSIEPLGAANSYSVTPDVRRGLTSPETRNDTPAQSANAASNQSPIENPKSQIEASSPPSLMVSLDVPVSADFLGSVAVSPYECGAAVVVFKTLEQESAHRARQAASAEP